MQPHDKGAARFQHHWPVDPRIQTWPDDDNHALLFWVTALGKTVWAFLFQIVVTPGIRRQKNDCVLFPCIHYVCYFYNGLEPECWYWELAFKRSGSLLAYTVAYIPLVPDTRPKVLLYIWNRGNRGNGLGSSRDL